MGDAVLNPDRPTKASSAQEAALEQAILALLAKRGPGKTICPSEAARAVAANDDEPARALKWRPLMETARNAAQRLATGGHVVITQGGHPVDPLRVKGPIRLRLK